MKILMVQRFDLLNVSCARRVLALAEELSKRGHRVTLVHFPHQERRQEIPNLLEHLPECLNYVEMNRSGSALRHNCRLALEVAKDADLVHLWKCYPDAAIPALYAAYRRDLPVHYDWDDYETGITRELTGSRWAAGTIQLWEQMTPALVDTLTVASEALREMALRCGASPERIWSAPVGADLSRFMPAEREPDSPIRIVYVGQLEVASFARLALEAFARIAPEYPEALLSIIGGGRHLESLRAQAKSLRLETRVELTGYVPAEDIPGILKQATLALAPFEDNQTTRCKSPLKIVEYLAAGLPVVGSHVGEVPRMLEGCGVCVPPDSADALASGIRLLLDFPDKRLAMRREARRRAEEIYNWKITVDHLEAAYQTALRCQAAH